MTPRALKRRHVSIARDLAADLGITEPTATERVLLAQLATLTLRSAQLQAVLERGELTAKQGLELTKTTSESRRIFLLLRHEQEPEERVPTVDDYLASLAAKPECGAIDDEGATE
jgi:hypothetical protein